MANRTIKDAISIKGVNPQYLIEKIIRTRVYDSRYWKEECFALTAELLVDKAMELKSIGGCYGGNVKPSPFICLILKMLQIQPEKDIIIEFIRNEDFKYVRALGAIYMRLTGSSLDIYKYLEPLYIDYRKMKRMNKMAKYELVHMDEFIDELLNNERVCDVSLPRIQKRHVLEEANELEPRISLLDVNLDDLDTSDSSSDNDEKDNDENDDYEKNDRKKSSKSSRSDKEKRNRSRSRSRSDSRDRYRDRDSDRHRDRDRYGEKDRSTRTKYKYVDYDNPDPENEERRYKRSPSPSKSKKSRRSKSKSRSPRSKSSKKRNETSSSVREKRQSRSRSRERDRERDRDRDRDKKHSKTHHHKSNNNRGSSSD